MKKNIIIFCVFFSLKSFAQYYVNADLYFIDGTMTNGLAHINILNDKIKFKNTRKIKESVIITKVFPS